jgi:AraC-like DNA-binding protein
MDAARADGVDVEALLARAGLTEAELVAPDARLSPAVGRELLGMLLSASPDPAITLRAAERFDVADADLLGYIVREAPHALGALEIVARFARLLGDSAECSMERDGAKVVFAVGRSSGTYLPEAADFYLGIITLFLRRRFGAGATPSRVTVLSKRPPRTDAYRRVFACPVVFGAEHATLVYPLGPLLAPLSGGDARLGEILHAGAVSALARLPKEASLLERALSLVSVDLEDGERGADHLAARLGVSERTLRRRLAEHGVSYRELLDRARHRRALELLGGGDRSVTEVALLVGFSDATSFTRAFRRWTGEAPRRFMRSQTG